MIGLTGIRVIVIDDEEKDALPIMKDLAKRGIPSAFFNGAADDNERVNRKITGVRLAILDMDLGWGGTSDKGKAAALVGYLGSILSSGNGPYGVLAWTNHPELIKEFENYAFVDTSLPRPIFTMQLTKAECKKRGKFKLDLISKKLEAKLRAFTPLLLLEAWEEECFNAATEVTNTLSKLADNNKSDLVQWRESWKLNFLQLIRTLAEAEVERNLDGSTCLGAFYDILNPLHADRMDSKKGVLSHRFIKKVAEILTVSGITDVKRKSMLNSMLHLSFERLESLAPGNVYLLSSENMSAGFVSLERLLIDLINPVKDTTGKIDKTNEFIKGILPKLKLVAVEVSAACDYAQKNVRLARFIEGVLVREDLADKFKRVSDGFISRFGPVFLDSKAIPRGGYFLFLSARHLVTVDVEKAKEMKPAMRLRTQALIVLQDWFTHHAGRPGMVLLTTK
jgi:hypothetical protein